MCPFLGKYIFIWVCFVSKVKPTVWWADFLFFFFDIYLSRWYFSHKNCVHQCYNSVIFLVILILGFKYPCWDLLRAQGKWEEVFSQVRGQVWGFSCGHWTPAGNWTVTTALLSQTLYMQFVKVSTSSAGTGVTVYHCHIAVELLKRDLKYPMYYLLALCLVTEAVGNLWNNSIRHFLWKPVFHKSIHK